MADSVETFFDAWKEEDAKTRLAMISSAVIESVRYSDPRTPEPLIGTEALNTYLGMFSDNAPGWSAKVLKSDVTEDVTRVTVEFGGPGPDGSHKVQLGQYFIEKKGDLVSRMVGFVGTGE
ncbi:MAG: hypothetical protein ABJ000_03870 [Saccharospirillum sp.]|uniref:hypothetical protein n=1 Tax=Saccharospirillum sp. TaxID=2033801 RepID=UPI003299EFC6